MNKKIFVVICLIILITVGIYADNNTTWRYDGNTGLLYHISEDIAIVTEENTEFPEDESVIITFSNIGGDIYCVFAVNNSLNLSESGGIDTIVYGDDLENLTDTFKVFYRETTDENTMFSLSPEDSYFLYSDMISGEQKVFIFSQAENPKAFLVFNINCDRLYRYVNYLY